VFARKKKNLVNKLSNYTKKNIGEPFKSGQKYYILDNKIPNCVNSIGCNQTFRTGETHPSLLLLSFKTPIILLNIIYDKN